MNIEELVWNPTYVYIYFFFVYRAKTFNFENEKAGKIMRRTIFIQTVFWYMILVHFKWWDVKYRWKTNVSRILHRSIVNTFSIIILNTFMNITNARSRTVLSYLRKVTTYCWIRNKEALMQFRFKKTGIFWLYTDKWNSIKL